MHTYIKTHNIFVYTTCMYIYTYIGTHKTHIRKSETIDIVPNTEHASSTILKLWSGSKTDTYIYIYIHTCTYTYIHRHGVAARLIHTYIHTYMYIHIHTHT